MSDIKNKIFDQLLSATNWLLVIFLSVVFSFGGSSVAEAVFTDKQLASALKEIKAEPKVKDAVWTSSGVLKAGVIADGSSKDGYAQYLCLVLYDHGFKGKNALVRVIDIVKLVKEDKWVNIGKATCQ